MNTSNFVNNILHKLEALKLYRILKTLIYLGYRRKGIKPQLVKYNKSMGLWEVKIDNKKYLTYAAGWDISFESLEQRLKKYSGNQYWPKKNDVVVDLGAGLGEETTIFSHLVGNEGMVYAIEANNWAYEALLYLTNENQYNNVKPLNFAISDSSGHIYIDNDEGDYVRSTIGDSSSKNKVKVAAFTFDDFTKKHNIQKIDLLKVNIEGAEQYMIKGMRKSVTFIKHVVISCHDFRTLAGDSDFYATEQVVKDFLINNGFDVTQRTTGDAVVDSYIFASRRL